MRCIIFGKIIWFWQKRYNFFITPASSHFKCHAQKIKQIFEIIEKSYGSKKRGK